MSEGLALQHAGFSVSVLEGWYFVSVANEKSTKQYVSLSWRAHLSFSY